MQNNNVQFGDRVEDFRSGLKTPTCSGMVSHTVAWIVLTALFIIALLPYFDEQLANMVGDRPTAILIGKCILFGLLAYLLVPDCVIKEKTMPMM